MTAYRPIGVMPLRSVGRGSSERSAEGRQNSARREARPTVDVPSKCHPAGRGSVRAAVGVFREPFL